MKRTISLLIACLVTLAACTRPSEPTPPPTWTPAAHHTILPPSRPTRVATLIVPTPNATHTPAPQSTEIYLVQEGDTLLQIALAYELTTETLMARNAITNADQLRVGQALVIPVQVNYSGPDFKIIPDSELVYGPAYARFDLAGFVNDQAGYLKRYTEEVNGQKLSGAQIVQWVAERYSVGPRVLLALIEYQAGWVTQAQPEADDITYPAGYVHPGYTGLLAQLAWAANHLNDGYYGWLERGYTTVRLGNGQRARIAAGLNAGSVGVQTALALTADFETWQAASGPQGLYATYVDLFDDPFVYAVEPLLPDGLTQPPLRLPWSDGETWYYTGGPHGAWGSGSAWAALDFTPPGQELGCYESEAWVASAAAGLVVYSRDGIVIVDLDGDGLVQTGWAIFYLHISPTGRAMPGARLQAGDPIGHASCEGGVSNGTHVHIARRYNGQWMAAEGRIPLVLAGWRAVATLEEYNGRLLQDSRVVEACECREAKNGLVAGPQ